MKMEMQRQIKGSERLGGFAWRWVVGGGAFPFVSLHCFVQLWPSSPRQPSSPPVIDA